MAAATAFSASAPPAVVDEALAGAPYLVVERDDGRIVARLSLAAEPAWVVRWNHSVTGVQVSDYYVFVEGSMVLTATHTPAFDAGLGHIPGRGRLESDGHGGYWIRGIDEPVPGNAYRLRVGSADVDHRIVHDGRIVSLSALAAGDAVTLRIEAR